MSSWLSYKTLLCVVVLEFNGLSMESLPSTTGQKDRSGPTGRLSPESASTRRPGEADINKDLGGFLDDDDTTFADMVNRPGSSSNEAPRGRQEPAATAVNDVDSQDGEDDDGPDLYTQFTEAIPVDKINSGLHQAGDLLYAAFNKAKEMGSENIQQVQDSETYNNLRTSATQNLEQLQQSDLGQQAAQAADTAKARAAEMKEEWSPTFQQARESAYSWMSSAAKSASSAAIWFQSMGTSGVDGDDSDAEPSTTTRGVRRTATMATAPVADAANPTIDDADLHDVTDTCPRLRSVREKVKITVGVLGTIFEGSIVENHEEVVADSDSDGDGGGESLKEIEEAEERPLPMTPLSIFSRDLAFRKKLLHNIDHLGCLPVEIKLMMTEEFREEVEAATGKKGSTEIEELAQHVEAIALK
ncbi:hypothetical protein FOZ60_002425 [Perkinsus olseni]|uniref:Uncharacterized protein n=1 Tax=Perkinsus olseni TaxID=32597 RepID=A0A7J6NY19_PEROL|nr:hypothetical protein FOZ60_002425 [Perkinsus olseni]